MGGTISLPVLALLYTLIGGSALGFTAAMANWVTKTNKAHEAFNLTNPNSPQKRIWPFLSKFIPLLLAFLVIPVYYALNVPFNRRKDLVKLISDDMKHFVANAAGPPIGPNIKVPEDVAKKAVDKIDKGKLQDTITQVKDDQTDKDEFVKLLAELNTAYAAGTVSPAPAGGGTMSMAYY